jgi:hypothetical protein
VDAPVKNDPLNYNPDMSKGGVKFDDGKLQWHLLPMQLLAGVVEVLMAGARKYAAWNWTRGMPYTRAMNAAQRHINAFAAGEDFDKDSGQHHIDHAICCLIFLRHFTINGGGALDDRFDLSTAVIRSGLSEERLASLKTMYESLPEGAIGCSRPTSLGDEPSFSAPPGEPASFVGPDVEPGEEKAYGRLKTDPLAAVGGLFRTRPLTKEEDEAYERLANIGG